jgi:hypothetical protein
VAKGDFGRLESVRYSQRKARDQVDFINIDGSVIFRNADVDGIVSWVVDIYGVNHEYAPPWRII